MKLTDTIPNPRRQVEVVVEGKGGVIFTRPGKRTVHTLGCEVLKRFNLIFDLVNYDLYFELIRR